MSAHTPGPWHTGGIFNPNSDSPTTWVWGPRKEPDHQSGPTICRDATLVDARLIAAAPDLLEALQKAADTIRDIGMVFSMLGKTTAVEACQIAEEASRAVIAKAEGQS